MAGRIITILMIMIILSYISSLSIPISYTKTNELPEMTNLRSNLQVDLYRNNFGCPNIKITLGTHRQEFAVFLSTIDNRFYITDYHSDQSSLYQTNDLKIPLNFIKKGMEGLLVTDSISLNSFTIDKFPFVHIQDSNIDYFYKGSLALGYHFPKTADEKDNYEYSILYQLKKAGMIDHYIISLSNDQTHPLLLLGEYPSNMPNNKKNQFKYKSCPLLPLSPNQTFNPYWQCNLNSVYLDDHTMFTINQPITYSLGGGVMNVPKVFFDYLINTYFTKAIKNNECNIAINIRHVVYCRTLISIELKEINLVFGKWTLKLKQEHLFQQSGNSFMFYPVLGINHFPDQWSLGLSIFKNEVIQPVFDGEKGEFGLLFNEYNK